MKTGKKISIVLIIILIIGGIYYSVTNCIFTKCDKPAVDSVITAPITPDTIAVPVINDTTLVKSDSAKK